MRDRLSRTTCKLNPRYGGVDLFEEPRRVGAGMTLARVSEAFAGRQVHRGDQRPGNSGGRDRRVAATFSVATRLGTDLAAGNAGDARHPSSIRSRPTPRF